MSLKVSQKKLVNIVIENEVKWLIQNNKKMILYVPKIKKCFIDIIIVPFGADR